MNALASCPPAKAFESLTTLATMKLADDVAVAPDGSLWVTDSTSAVAHITATGSLLQRIGDPRAPEGVVVMSDGTLLLAEQTPDRVVHLNPATMAETVVVQLQPRAGTTGVDGIAFEAATDTVLVPDAANGTLLTVAMSSGHVSTLASGMGRPVGVARLGDGSFVVASESETGLYHVPPHGGTPAALGNVVQGDDVVVTGAVAYVTSLQTQQVLAVDSNTGDSTALVAGVSMPQGLALRPDGGLALADSATGRVAAVSAC